MKIIDLSAWNTIDIKQAVREVDGVILRVGYRGYGNGKIVQDKKFSKYLAQVLESGKPWGIYFVTQAISPQESEQEAQFCIDALKNVNKAKLCLGIWHDHENGNGGRGRGDSISVNMRKTNADAFCAYLNKVGYKAGVYASESWVTRYFTDCKYPLWIAKYSKNKPKYPCAMWQYTSSGKVTGCNGRVDFSECYFLENDVKPSTSKPVTGDIPSLKGYKGFSIVNGLKSFGYESSFAYRKQLAERLGIVNYKGTAKQNLTLLSILKTR